MCQFLTSILYIVTAFIAFSLVILHQGTVASPGFVAKEVQSWIL